MKEARRGGFFGEALAWDPGALELEGSSRPVSFIAQPTPARIPGDTVPPQG